jgi:hypothetical protein
MSSCHCVPRNRGARKALLLNHGKSSVTEVGWLDSTIYVASTMERVPQITPLYNSNYHDHCVGRSEEEATRGAGSTSEGPTLQHAWCPCPGPQLRVWMDSPGRGHFQGEPHSGSAMAPDAPTRRRPSPFRSCRLAHKAGTMGHALIFHAHNLLAAARVQITLVVPEHTLLK